MASQTARLPRDAIGFDFDGATFTQRGARVALEVLMASFGLDEDRALARLAALVHYLDVGGLPVSEAAGLEALLAGARQSCKTDDVLPPFRKRAQPLTHRRALKPGRGRGENHE